MGKLTIMQVVPAMESGGVERGVLEVADAVVRAGHRSIVVSRGGRMVEALEAAGSEHFECPIGKKSPLTLRWIPWLRRLIQEERVDAVDYHSRLPGWITLAALRSIPPEQRPHCISSLHGLHSVNAYSSVMCRGDSVVVVSEAVRSYAREHFPWVDQRGLHLIYRGIDEREFPRGYQASQAWRDAFFDAFPRTRSGPRLALVGRITRLKGHHDFLDLMVRLRAAGVRAQAMLIGGAQRGKEAYRDELVARVKREGLSDQVTWTGPRTDLKEIYSISDAVLSLSQTPESFGRTVAEALAVGTPVVGYDHGGVAEILRAEFPRGAVPLGDLEGLVERVRWVLSHRRELEIGRNRFSLAEMQGQTVTLYERVATAKRWGTRVLEAA